VYIDFQEVLEEQFVAICGFRTAVRTTARGRKFVKILKHFARGKIKLVN
jgi:hypothetical protein